MTLAFAVHGHTQVFGGHRGVAYVIAIMQRHGPLSHRPILDVPISWQNDAFSELSLHLSLNIWLLTSFLRAIYTDIRQCW